MLKRTTLLLTFALLSCSMCSCMFLSGKRNVETLPSEVPTATAETDEVTLSTEPTTEAHRPDANPSDKVEYDIIRKDRSYKDESGKVLIEHYFDLVVVKGDGEGISAVNKAFEAEMERFLFDDAEMAEYIASPQLPEGAPFVSTCDTEITYNANGFICAKYTTSWYMGGVYNANSGGASYNLETGSPATLPELTKTSPTSLDSEIREAAWVGLQEAYGTALDFNAYERLSGYRLEDYKFYIDDAEIILLFDTYEFSFGAAGPAQVRTGIYLSEN